MVQKWCLEKKKLSIRLGSYSNELKRLEKEFRQINDQIQQTESRNQLLGATIDVMAEENCKRLCRNSTVEYARTFYAFLMQFINMVF